MVLTARGWSGWVALTADVLLRRNRTSHVVRTVFRELRVQLDRPQLWELDGEVMGTTRQLVVAVQPSRLLIRVPR
jgi:diacylglycerol kinase family enzyme